MTEQQKRINKIRDVLSNDNEALIVTSNSNVYYYTGFNNSEGTVVITKKQSYLLVDFRYIETAKRIVNSCEVVMFNSLYDVLVEVLKDNNTTFVYTETKDLTFYSYNKIKNSLNKSGIKVSSSNVLDSAIENQRMVKSKEELDLIEKAQDITEISYREILPLIKPGVKEIDIKNELEYRIKKNGGEGVSFDLITITGKKTSLPHGVAGDEVIKKGDFFTLDIGSLYKGYHSDMTRTVAVGKVSDKQKEIYNIVLNAQMSALEMVKSGVSCSDIDKTARDIISKAGYGECFGHSTGHGVGLNIHEKPNVSPKGDIILSKGMVITIEPGIYLENQFGVRIEDMVAVTDKGYYNFAKLDKELLVL